MKKLLATTVSSVLTLSSLVLTFSPQANALTSAFQTVDPFSPITTFPTNPEPILSESSQEKLIADVFCEIRTNGYRTVTCCIDSYGNWVCGYQ